MPTPLRSPFPYFGGKSRPAAEIWTRFGNVPNYVEPFCGSAAVLLARPHATPRKELVNDLDSLLVNVWRALRAEPDTIADIIDYPLTEIDVLARHNWLVAHRDDLRARLLDSPTAYDPKAAGYWLYVVSGWFGSDAFTKPITIKKPCITAPRGCFATTFRAALRDRCAALAARLQNVRILSGDWTRCLTPSVTTGNGLTAILLDPPYSAAAGYSAPVYRESDMDLAHAVRRWAIANGSNPKLRIALCGYDGEHINFPAGWTCHAWTANGGYSNAGATYRQNKHRERIWFSPHCLPIIPSSLPTYRPLA